MQEPYLEIHQPGRSWEMPLGDDPVTIGRHSDNRLVLDDTLASRFHCLISKTKEGFILRDLNSSNGTALNGKVVRYSELFPGDAVTVGHTRLVLVVPNGQTDATPTKPAAPAAPKAAERPKAAPPPRGRPPVRPAPPPETEPPAPVPLEELGNIEPVQKEEEAIEFAEPLTDEDVVPEEPVAMDAAGRPLVEAGDDDVGEDMVALQDPLEVISSLARSLPDQSFTENDIALLSARGQLIHAAGVGSTRENREGVECLRRLLLLCSRAHATDVHFEPKGGQYVIRMRIDGSMVEVCRISNALGVRLSALVKVLSEIDIAQKNTVQEGHFSSRVPPGRRIDYRVSFAPSVYGQKLVVRVLDTSYAPLHLKTLQMPEWMRTELERVIRQEAGMVLVCGPTGSGKTTSLYALIRASDIAHRNVVTIEDPVEIQIEGVTQIPVDEDKDRSFSNLLRSTLRQDPDVILIGEIRDAETARIAMQAAITGHLVFSTVHTQNTTGTIFRLLDLGVEPYLVAQALHVVVAQRLVRQLCPYCKQAVKPSPKQVERMGPSAALERVYEPRGCVRCLHTGFSGRRAIFELLTATDELRELIPKNPSPAQLQAALASTPFQTLHQSGYALAAEGIVSLDEIDRVIGREPR